MRIQICASTEHRDRVHFGNDKTSYQVHEWRTILFTTLSGRALGHPRAPAHILFMLANVHATLLLQLVGTQSVNIEATA
jgi:hypothetical protein